MGCFCSNRGMGATGNHWRMRPKAWEPGCGQKWTQQTQVFRVPSESKTKLTRRLAMHVRSSVWAQSRENVLLGLVVVCPGRGAFARASCTVRAEGPRVENSFTQHSSVAKVWVKKTWDAPLFRRDARVKTALEHILGCIESRCLNQTCRHSDNTEAQQANHLQPNSSIQRIQRDAAKPGRALAHSFSPCRTTWNKSARAPSWLQSTPCGVKTRTWCQPHFSSFMKMNESQWDPTMAEFTSQGT